MRQRKPIDQEVRKPPEKLSQSCLGRAHVKGSGSSPAALLPFKIIHPGAQQTELEKFTESREEIFLSRVYADIEAGL